MPFKDNNVAVGVPVGSPFQQGISDVDAAALTVEQGIAIPTASDPSASWVYFDCTVGVMLDSGIAVHNHLPQVDRTADTLGSALLDDSNLDKLAGLGVNLRCRDQYRDIVQRMGHARYWFRLWGQALRFGFQVPIPKLVTIGGVPAVPYDRNPQWAFNRIAPGANYSGSILWHAAWSLWYTTLVPPVSNAVPAADPAAHIALAGGPENAKPTDGMQAPFSQPDDDATTVAPPTTQVPARAAGNVARRSPFSGS